MTVGLMSRVNNVEENIIPGEIKPRRIKSQGNSCPGGKFWRKTYREEKVWGKDGAKPSRSPSASGKSHEFGRVLATLLLCRRS